LSALNQETELCSSRHRPTVILYRPPDSVGGGSFYEYLFRPKEDVLRLFFELIVVCDEEQFFKALSSNNVDLVVFLLNGIFGNIGFSKRFIRKVSGIAIPKLFLHSTDPFAISRKFVSHVMESLGVNAVLLGDLVTNGYQEINLPTFYWGWSVDLRRFVQVEKTFDLFASSRNSGRPGYYMWRVQNASIIESSFDRILVATNDPWDEFQRKLSSCKFAYTCGSCSNTIVQKHLEIPASRTILIAESTSLVEMFGFQDMKNCVLGSGSDLKDKLEYLKNNLDICDQIADEGFKLVSSRHLHIHRTQAFDLLKLIQKGEDLKTYVQESPIGPIVKKPVGLDPYPIWLKQSPPRDLELIRSVSTMDVESRASFIDYLASYLRQDHPDLAIMNMKVGIEQRDPIRLANAIKHSMLNVHGLPDYLIYEPSIESAYREMIVIKKLKGLRKRVANLGLFCLKSKGDGPVSVFLRLLFIVVGAKCIDVLSIRNCFYFAKLYSQRLCERIRGQIAFLRT